MMWSAAPTSKTANRHPTFFWLDIRNCLVLEDSFNGVRAGHAAGAVTVMVPDMAQPDAEIRSLYTRCCRDLFEVRDLLRAGEL